MLAGRRFEAVEALQLGLVTYITEPDDPLAKTREILSIINQKAPIAISRIIECANLAAGDGATANGAADWEADPFGGEVSASEEGGRVRNGFLREQVAFGECFATEDMQGASAFIGERKPGFKG